MLKKPKALLPARQSFNQVVLFQRGTDTESPIPPGAKAVHFLSVSSSNPKSLSGVQE